MAEGGDKSRRRKRRKRGILFRPLAYIVMVAAMLFGISVFFKITEIEVNGNVLYTTEQIVEASGIETGGNLFFLYKNKITDNIFKELSYVDEVTVKQIPPGTVAVGITESYPLAVIFADEKYYIIDKNCKVLEQINYSSISGKINIHGLSVEAPVVGSRLVAIEPDGSKLDCLKKLLPLILKHEMQDDVSLIDVSNISGLTFEYMNRFTVELGKSDILEYKLSVVDSIVVQLSQNDNGIIDVSSVSEGKGNFIPR